MLEKAFWSLTKWVTPATHPIARLPRRLALLLRLAGNGPAALSRLVARGQPPANPVIAHSDAFNRRF